MRVLLINDEKITTQDIQDYKDYYPLLNCQSFDIARVMWQGSEISIFVDDEGFFVKGNTLREVVGYPQPLAGNLVIAGGVDTSGRTLPCPDWLSEELAASFITVMENKNMVP